MPSPDHFVIIGNGPAGNQAAVTLREKDPRAKITIISDENIPFYYKPKLTEYIAGHIEEEALVARPHDFYKERDIRLRLGQSVQRIDTEKKRILLSHMEDIHYTHLLIASGARERLLPAMESYADYLHFITSFKGVMDFRDKIQQGDSFFIIGGDLVGFKFLKMLRSMSKKVTLLIYPHAFWPFTLSEDMLSIIVSQLKKTGADILARDDTDSIIPRNNKYLVTTRRGREIPVDMVFSFNGLIPSIEFAKGSGLDMDRGILVNEYLQTNVEGVYACGSCAQIFNPDINAYTTSLGWPNAEVQGNVAAANLLGAAQKIENVGRKYFDLEGVKIKTTWWEDIGDNTNP